jgi:ornithine cyclodeaminase/alanine dehydrogenase-like protein (mu-crystallin family)
VRWLGPDAIAADLAEIVRGEHPERVKAEEVTIFGAVGMPMLDLVVSWTCTRAHVGDTKFSVVDFLG